MRGRCRMWGCLQAYYPPAQWVQDAVPDVTKAVTTQAVKKLAVSLPPAVVQATKWLLSGMGLDSTPIEGRALEPQYLGAGDSYRLILNSESRRPSWTGPRSWRSSSTRRRMWRPAARRIAAGRTPTPSRPWACG